MPHQRRARNASDFAPLLAYLATQEEAVVTLSLPRIAGMMGAPLPEAGYTHHTFWSGSSVALVGILIAAGWRAHLRVPAQVVIFTRLAPPAHSPATR